MDPCMSGKGVRLGANYLENFEHDKTVLIIRIWIMAIVFRKRYCIDAIAIKKRFALPISFYEKILDRLIFVYEK